MSRKLHKWSCDEKEYLKKITYGKTYKEIQSLLNNKFNLNLSITQISSAIKRNNLKTGLDGRFEKGHIPFNKNLKGYMGANKTSFKKGNIPLNLRPVWSERINIEGYIEVKTPSKWKLKHRQVWEQHYGEVPKGCNILFLDNNKLNCNIENLAIVNRKEHLFINRNGLRSDDPEITKTGIALAKLIIKAKELEKK